MDNQMNFDYYYGLEGEQFSYVRIPKLIMMDKVFSGLTDRAKILYGVLLDRMSLSRKNHWLDDMNRVYIIFSIQEVCTALGCSKPSACKALSELDTDGGIGLIERHRRGQGKPDIIYVKNFISYVRENDDVGKDIVWNPKATEADIEIPVNTGEISEVKDFYFKKSNSLNSKKLTSKGQKDLPQEVKDVDPNNTELIYTEDENNLILSNQSDKIDRMDECSAYMQLVRENIEYDELMSYKDPERLQRYDEMYQLICDVVCVNRDKIRINGEEYPYQLVKSQFLKLKREHLEYVAECMQKNYSKVTNIRAYLITALYNAPSTIGNFEAQDYRAENKKEYKSGFDYEQDKRLERNRRLTEEGVPLSERMAIWNEPVDNIE